jgi:hypothetical protein
MAKSISDIEHHSIDNRPIITGAPPANPKAFKRTPPHKNHVKKIEHEGVKKFMLFDPDFNRGSS